METQGAGPAAAVAAFVAAATGESGRPEDVYATRVRDKWLPLDNPDRRKSARTQTRRKVPFKMNADERRRLRAGDIPADKRTYALYEPLHALWAQYAEGVVGDDTSPAALAVKVSKLDLHGAVLRVARSRHPPYVGLEGIVAKESTNMFYLVTRANELKIVPKLSNVFTVAIGAATVATLYGNQLVCRPGERIVRKFKSKGTIDL